MSKFKSVCRLTVIAESELEKTLVDEFMKMGAKGYTCTDCRGRGEHVVTQDPFRAAGHVRIETIVQPQVAEVIMDYLDSPRFRARALTACLESVDVQAHDRF